MISYEKLLDDFKALLKENDLKFTKQRELVLKFLYENNEHFTPEEIYMQLKQQHPNMTIGIATVYRTLTLLEGSEIVSSISFGAQGKKYEFGLKKHHDHLICVKCGSIVEFYDSLIEERQKIIVDTFGFQMTDHVMKIVGICKDCQIK